MKKINMRFLGSAVALAAVVSLSSCMSETPFSTAGEGSLRIDTEIRGDVVKVSTRAEAQYDEEVLNNNLVVYIEKGGKVVRKYKGLDNVPAEVSLMVGSYVVEGWTGDSVSASFDKKFYRGYQKVAIAEGENTMELKCNIANVLASVDTQSLNGALSDLKVTVGHSRGELVFTPEMIASDPTGENNKGYFMMPNADKSLHYKLEGKDQNGKDYVKEGDIENVERAHHYTLALKANASDVAVGGALVRLEIVDTPVIDEEVEVFPAPGFKAYEGSGQFDMDENQVVSTPGNFSEVRLRVLYYGGVNNLSLGFSDNFTGVEGCNGVNLSADNAAQTALENLGVKLDRRDSKDAVAGATGKDMEVTEYWIYFKKSFLDNLPASNNEYSIEISAVDGRGFSCKKSLRIANSDAAIERKAPVGASPVPDANTDPMAVGATSVTLTGNIYSEDAADYGFLYREFATTDEWTKVAAQSTTRSATRGAALGTFTVKLTGLKAATTYEFKSYCGEFVEAKANTFTTEAKFIIPNAGMEDWSEYGSSIIFPGAGSERSFWDSGNEGAKKAGTILTERSADIKHGGNYAARLESKFASVFGIGKFAAGNLFAGTYVKTDGTDGVLSFGRPYNGSHPSALSVWVNYRPGKVTDRKTENLNGADKDFGQVYVALSTEPVEILTKKSQKLFDPKAPVILAYGEKTFSADFGADGVLENVRIDLEYYEAAKTTKPLYLIIVCSASKFGDYFEGGRGSVMYLDDFELIYE